MPGSPRWLDVVRYRVRGFRAPYLLVLQHAVKRDGRDHRRLVPTQQIADEHIRVLRLDAEWREAIRRKVLQVHRHQHIRAAGDGGGENVAVVGIRQVDRVDQTLVACDQAVHHMGVHELARPLELHCQFRALPQHRPDPFLVDRVRPSRPEKLRHGEAHQQIAQWRRMQHAGVEKDREHRHSPRGRQ